MSKSLFILKDVFWFQTSIFRAKVALYLYLQKYHAFFLLDLEKSKKKFKKLEQKYINCFILGINYLFSLN